MLEKIGESSIRKNYVYYHCTDCNSVDWMREDHFRNGIGCSICAGRTVRVGYNDFATLRPDLVQYFKNEYDMILNTKTSHTKVKLKCPVCGNEKDRWLHDLYRRGYRCPVCYGGYSFPARYMSAVLQSLNIRFKTEKTFAWSKRYRYDFYIEDYSTIIEVNGRQHYRERVGWTPIDIIKKSDNEKRELANANDIKHYFVIDSLKSDVDELNRNIIQSGLLDVLHVNKDDIDWVRVIELADQEIALKTLEYWKTGNYKTSDIAKLLEITTETVRKYIKIYAKKGLCYYDPHESIMECQKLASEARKHPVICVNTGELFESIKAASQRYGLARTSITQCLSGKSKSAGKDKNGNKLYWKYA